MSEESGFSRPDLGQLIGLVMAAVGTAIGSRRLSDNSFLTHLATGREVISHGFMHSDVFTWTSSGTDLVVQSWLASASYGLLDRYVGGAGIRIMMAVTAGALSWVSWRLTDRSASLFTRILVMLPVLIIGVEMWRERPLLVALVLFGLTLLIVESERSVASLGLVGFIWIGVHGSWPLGLVLLATRAVGSWFDGGKSERHIKAFGWLAAGVVVGGVVNPYGPRLLVFPAEVLGQRAMLARVTEWMSPSFDALYTRAFLVLIVMMVIAVSRRSTWCSLLPALVFVAAALVSLRNIPVAALAMLPLLADGLPAVGRIEASETSRLIETAGRVAAAGLFVFPLVAVSGANFDLSTYPVAAVDAMEASGISPADVPTVHPDSVGNYIDYRYGSAGAAWIDDRYELHPRSLMADYLIFHDASTGWRDVLERSGAGAMIWTTGDPITQLVRDVAGWQTFWSDDDWTVLCDPSRRDCKNLSNSN